MKYVTEHPRLLIVGGVVAFIGLFFFGAELNKIEPSIPVWAIPVFWLASFTTTIGFLYYQKRFNEDFFESEASEDNKDETVEN